MKMARTIVIGDIHGCYDELIELIEKIELTLEDRVIAVGDLTVKGPKSREVLELFSRNPRFSSVIGNHDLALVNFWKDETSSLKTAQQRTFDELAGNQHLFEFLASLPPYLELESHVIVHAGIRPGVSLSRQAIADLVELRTLGPDRTSREGTPWYELYNDDKVVMFGHWPSSSPRIGRRAIGLDTGCVYGYQLTAYILEDHEFISVNAHAAYDRPPKK
jgi:diadenosine tetraphosphatase ApaH/serine/threonine PP2A family protein phosphatase